MVAQRSLSISERTKTPIFPFLIVVLMWGIFILPSSFYPYWCYLDDPTSLSVGRWLAENLYFPRPGDISERYLPAYWLYYALLFKLFGFNLHGYYGIQALMFLLTLLLAYSVVCKITRSVLCAIVASFLITTSSPVAENVYTLGKAEPRLLFCLVCSCSIFVDLVDRNGNNGISIRKLSWFGIALFIFVATFTKETAVVMSFFSLGGAAAAYFLKRKKGLGDQRITRDYLILLGATTGPVIIARLLQAVLRSSNRIDRYTTYQITADMVINNLKFYVVQQADVFLLGVLAVVLTSILYRHRERLDIKSFVLLVSFTVAGMVYFAAMLFWRQPMGYYLLVPAVFFSIAPAVALRLLRQSPGLQKILYLSLALIVFSRVHSVSYFSYIAHAQKMQDKTYTEAIESYVRAAQRGERLLLEQWPFFAEPVVQSNLLVKKIFGKEELLVEGVQDIAENMVIPEETLKLYGVSKIPDKASRTPRKNDYILSIVGNRQSSWSLRGISPFLNERESFYKAMGLTLKEVSAGDSRWKGLEFRIPLILPMIQTYSAGYRLYKVEDALPSVVWEGRWSDGWIGSRARCSLRSVRGKNEFVFAGNVMEFSVPSALVLTHENRLVKRVPLDRAGPFSFTVTLTLPSGPTDGLVEIEINSEKTFNPKALGLSNDDRDLGVQLGVKKAEGEKREAVP